MNNLSSRIYRPHFAMTARAAVIFVVLCLVLQSERRSTRNVPSSLVAAEPPATSSQSKNAPIPNPPDAADKPIGAGEKTTLKDADQSDTVSKREDALLTDEIELQKLLRNLGPDHPKVLDVKSRIKVTKEWLTEQRGQQKTLVVKISGRSASDTAKVLTDLYSDRAKVTIDEASGSVIIVITQSKSATESRALINEIRTTVNLLGPASPESEQAPQIPAPGIFPSDERDAELDREAKQLALRIRSAKPNERPALRKELTTLTERQFANRQERRKLEFDSLGLRVERLKALHTHRQTHKDEVIERRVKELLDPDADLKWEPSDSSEVKKIVARESGTSLDVNSTETTAAREGTTRVPRNATADAAEPTYNGVRLSEWLRLLKSERNADKIAESVLAMNFLIDEAEPRLLARTTLEMMRTQGTQNLVNSSQVIMFGATKLLKRLPSEIVVDELIAELEVSHSRLQTRNFFDYFLNSFRSQSNVGMGMGGLAPGANNLEYFRLQQFDPYFAEAEQRLQRTLRLRSRRLVSILVSAHQEDNTSKWEFWTAFTLVELCKQPLSSYPELVPLVEDRFLAESQNPQKPNVYSLKRLGTMLGESGIRVSEVMAFAEQRLIEFPGNFSEAKSFEIQAGIQCLKAVAPHSPAAADRLLEISRRLTEILRDQWTSVSVPAANDVSSTPTLSAPFSDPNVLSTCEVLFKYIADIGRREAIPVLQEISESPNANLVAPMLQQGSFFGNESFIVRQGKTLKDGAIAAIKQIELPKLIPEPLPDDVPMTKSDPLIEGSKPGITNTARATAKQLILGGAETVDKPKSTLKEPTYNSVTLSEWLTLLEIERNPNKILDAVRAMQYLTDKADPRQLARVTFHTMSIHGTIDYTNTDWQILTSVINQSKRLLTQLPVDIVVDEAIKELKETGLKKTTQGFFLEVLSSIGIDPQFAARRQELRRRSRQLIGTFVEIARQDEGASVWAVYAASQIIQISEQPITVYPELVPLVERVFTLPYDKSPASKLPALTFNSGQMNFPVAAIMLGQSGLRIPEVLAFAEERLDDTFELKPTQLQGGVLTEFEKGVKCLAAVAPHSPEAVNRLVELLEIKWKEVISEPDKPGFGFSAVDPTAMPKLYCSSLVEALGDIGTPAKESLPQLRTIAESPTSKGIYVVPQTAGNVSLSVRAERAIKRIKEAKPKPKPEPLPEDS